MVQLIPGPDEAPRKPAMQADPPPTIEILIPIHNEWHVLRPCLDSVEAFTTQVPNLSITILDDGSDVFVQQRIRAWVDSGGIPKRILRNESALGFVQNSNRGFRESTADMVLLSQQ